MTPLPVDIIDQAWQRELRSPLLRSRLAAWCELEPALAGFRDPVGLLRFLHGAGSADEKDRVLHALLHRARSDEFAGRFVLAAMMPGLKRLARGLLGAHAREEVWSALLSCMWERIRRYPSHRRGRVAANLLLDTRKHALRALGDTGARCVVVPEYLPATAGSGDVVAVLHGAVTAGAITAAEARLILHTRIDGRPLYAVARSLGISLHALTVRRLRAERRLLVHLGCGRVTHRAPRRRSCAARVVGAGPAGQAGAKDQSNTPKEVNTGP